MPLTEAWLRGPRVDWLEGFRPHQVQAVEKVLAHYEAGKRVVLLDAPTGAGKSIIGEMVRRELDVPTTYSCTTKALQDQFQRDFPYAKVVKGRSNYPTDTPHTTAADHHPNCSLCADEELCRYRLAREAAANSPLAVVNTSYLLSDRRGRFIRPFMVIDEADCLEDELMGQVEVVISRRMQKVLGMTRAPRHKTKPDSWGEWLPYAIELCAEKLAGMPKPKMETIAQRRLRMMVENLHERLVLVEPETWVYDGWDQGSIIFRPVWVERWGREKLWDKVEESGGRVLLMSATILSDVQMGDELGLRRDEYAWVKVPSTFPVENRPVYFTPVSDMSYNTRGEDWVQTCEAVQAIRDRHPDDRILVHTVSYTLATWIHDHLQMYGYKNVLTYGSAVERAEVLELYLNTPGAILIAPSMERGVDLPDDACRVVVVCKVPYLSTADKQVNARLYAKGRRAEGQRWYATRAVRSLIQMTGRGTRHAEDRSSSYILDGRFMDLYKRWKELFPEWWVESIRWMSPERKRLSSRYETGG